MAAGLHPHEEALVRAFLTGERRKQFLARLTNPRTREKLVLQLAHFHDLDRRFAHRIPAGEQHTEMIFQQLKQKGAPTVCHVISDNDALDGRDVLLRDALEQTVGSFHGTLISCIPGRLGYFEGEEPNERYILER